MNVPVRLTQSLVAAAMIVLSACTRDQTCVEPPIVQSTPVTMPALVSPASGATGVSTGPLDVTIGSATAASALFVKDVSGNVTFATNFRQANPPSNDVRIGTFAHLASQTTYQVYAVVLGSGPTTFRCSPNAQSISSQNIVLGTFTTT
jgi:hypothetical protein